VTGGRAPGGAGAGAGRYRGPIRIDMELTLGARDAGLWVRGFAVEGRPSGRTGPRP